MTPGTVAVIVASYGDRKYWDELANRALRSVRSQSRPADEVIRIHHPDSLQKARNLGAEQASTEWLIFLDADDELHFRYIEEMLTGRGDLRQPAITNIAPNGRETSPYVLPMTPLEQQNCLVIGTMIRREQFLRIGGFDDYPVLEDWALWIKAWLDGAVIGTVAKAIYRIHLRPGSRNHQYHLHRPVQEEVRKRFLPQIAQRRKTQRRRPKGRRAGV